MISRTVQSVRHKNSFYDPVNQVNDNYNNYLIFNFSEMLGLRIFIFFISYYYILYVISFIHVCLSVVYVRVV